MAKFINSSESITSSMLLWNDVPTQVSIQKTFDIKVWPITNILNEGPINVIDNGRAPDRVDDLNQFEKIVLHPARCYQTIIKLSQIACICHIALA